MKKPMWAISKTGTPSVINTTRTKRKNQFTAALEEKAYRKPDSRMKVRIHEEPAQTVIRAAGFHQTLPDSHFWTDLEQIKTFISQLPESETQKYILKGLTNTIANGYKLVRTEIPAREGEFFKTVGTVKTNFEPLSMEKFRLILATKQPKELFHSMYSNTQPIFVVTSYAVGAQRSSDWYVRGYYTNWADKKPRKMTLSNLYRSFRTQGLAQFYFKSEK